MNAKLDGDRRDGAWGLLWRYTLLFALFFAVVMSPFWLYGRAFLWGADGMGQYLPGLTYSRQWIKEILQNLRQGRLEVPFWSLTLGFGQNVINNAVSFRPTTALYWLLGSRRMELFLALRFGLGLYASGLAFLVFGKTRVRDRTALLLGAMIYVFSGFIPAYAPKHSHFLGMTAMMPLMLLGVDQIFEGKWSWLFIFAVFKEGVVSFYPLFLTTAPAVVYALFHYFELNADARRRCGGFGRILLRHIAQYAAGLGLAAVGLLPSLFSAFTSSRTAVPSDVSLWHWSGHVYLDFLRGLVDPVTIGSNGYIALPALGLVGVVWTAYRHNKGERVLWGQVALYAVVFLVPALTMAFNGFAGKNLRWSYALTFWAALAAAYALSQMESDADPAFKFARRAFWAYALVYLVICVWMGEDISLSLVAAFFGLLAIGAALSDWGRQRRALAVALVAVALLAELTTKTYVRYSPQYGGVISGHYNAEKLVRQGADNAASALAMAGDDGLYRVDVVLDGTKQVNYGLRNQVNGVSSYYSLNSGRISEYSLALGNAAQKNRLLIASLDQRTVLDALAGVKYVAALEGQKDRVPYGYEAVGARKKKLSDGSSTTEYLYQNKYALPLSYAYESWISEEAYAALPPNRKEQAMLQGVVLEVDAGLEPANLQFDDAVLLDDGALLAALAEAAEKDANLEVSGGCVRVRKANLTVTLPAPQAEGEIYLQLLGLRYAPVNYDIENYQNARRDGSTRLTVMKYQRNARQWEETTEATLTATSGALSDSVDLLGKDQQYYFGARDVLLNLGYGRTGETLKLKFSDPGEYRFDGAQLICQPMDAYAEKLAPLQARAASSVAVDGNRVTVEYDLEKPALACLAVACDAGWSARVDGERAQIVPANGMYMGVMLPAGRHTVVFTYACRGFWLGAAISAATLIALVAGGILMRRRRKGERKTA